MKPVSYVLLALAAQAVALPSAQKGQSHALEGKEVVGRDQRLPLTTSSEYVMPPLAPVVRPLDPVYSILNKRATTTTSTTTSRTSSSTTKSTTTTTKPTTTTTTTTTKPTTTTTTTTTKPTTTTTTTTKPSTTTTTKPSTTTTTATKPSTTTTKSSTTATTTKPSISTTTTTVRSTTRISSTVDAELQSSSRSSSTTSKPSSTTTTTTTPKATTTTTTTTLKTSTTTTTKSSAQATRTFDVTGMGYQQAMLAVHNLHRANHSIPNLVWNQDLADTAQKIANNCVYGHNVTADGGGYGQNIGAGAPGTQATGLITNLMYNNEINYYPGPYGQDEIDISNFHIWGHYSQLVWADTTDVGCVTKYCPNGLGNTSPGVAPYFTVCNYSPPGNYVDEWSSVAAPGKGQTVVVVGGS